MPGTRLPAGPSPIELDRVLWDVLVAESGAGVAVLDRAGRAVFANGISLAAYARMAQLAGRLAPPDAGVSPDPERAEICRRVCDAGETILHESFIAGARRRILTCPVRGRDGSRLCLSISRRLHANERLEDTAPPDAVIVRLSRSDLGELARLTPREIEILSLIGDGMTYAQIAEKLGRSIRTVERHRDSMCAKLGVTNRVDLARMAFRAGLSDTADPIEGALIEPKPGTAHAGRPNDPPYNRSNDGSSPTSGRQ